MLKIYVFVGQDWSQLSVYNQISNHVYTVSWLPPHSARHSFSFPRLFVCYGVSLFVCLGVCLSVYVCLSVSVCVCLSVSQSVSVSVCQCVSVCLSVSCLFVFVCLCLFGCLFVSLGVCFFVWVFVCFFVCLFLCLGVCLFGNPALSGIYLIKVNPPNFINSKLHSHSSNEFKLDQISQQTDRQILLLIFT